VATAETASPASLEFKDRLAQMEQVAAEMDQSVATVVTAELVLLVATEATAVPSQAMAEIVAKAEQAVPVEKVELVEHPLFPQAPLD
jgi:hypothetical protein